MKLILAPILASLGVYPPIDLSDDVLTVRIDPFKETVLDLLQSLLEDLNHFIIV